MTATFGARLRHVRKTRKLTQKEFADRLNINPITVIRLEQRDRCPHDELIMALMKEFGVDCRWMLTGEGSEYGEGGVTVFDSIEGESAAPTTIGKIALPGLPEKGSAVRVVGDDLLPSVREGDYVVYVEEPPGEGDLVVYRSELGETRVRRYSEHKGLTALHPDYPPTPVDRVQIVGRVLQVVRQIELPGGR